MAVSFHSILAAPLAVRGLGIVSDASRPRLKPDTLPYNYAVLVLTGTPERRAAHVVGVTYRTAERWRKELRRQAEEYFGEPVTYQFAAWYALDGDLRQIVVALATENRPAPFPVGPFAP